MFTPRLRQHGFSIPELLAVVAILLIILAMLLPALGRSRDAVHQTICSSNLHQQGLALVNYVTDTMHYPGHAARSQAGHIVAVWPVRLREYADDIDVFNCPAEPPGFHWRHDTGAPGGVYATQDDADQWGYRVGERLLIVGGASGLPFCYGYNDWGRWNILRSPQRGLGADLNFGVLVPHLKKSQVRSASAMIAIGDNTSDGSWDYNMDPTQSWEYPGKIHYNGCNMVFADAHVEWDLQKNWTNVDLNTEAGKSMSARWNNHNEPTADQN